MTRRIQVSFCRNASTVRKVISAARSCGKLEWPEKLQKELEPFVKNELTKALGKGVEASFAKKINGGFKIGPKDGSYFISLTDESFQELIGDYLRPTTKEILFG